MNKALFLFCPFIFSLEQNELEHYKNEYQNYFSSTCLKAQEIIHNNKDIPHKIDELIILHNNLQTEHCKTDRLITSALLHTFDHETHKFFLYAQGAIQELAHEALKDPRFSAEQSQSIDSLMQRLRYRYFASHMSPVSSRLHQTLEQEKQETDAVILLKNLSQRDS